MQCQDAALQAGNDQVACSIEQQGRNVHPRQHHPGKQFCFSDEGHRKVAALLARLASTTNIESLPLGAGCHYLNEAWLPTRRLEEVLLPWKDQAETGAEALAPWIEATSSAKQGRLHAMYVAVQVTVQV